MSARAKVRLSRGWTLALVLAFVALPMADAGASIDEAADHTQKVRLLNQELTTPGPDFASQEVHQQALWFWRGGGRIFTVARPNATQTIFKDLVAYDMQTLREVDRVTLPSDAAVWASGQAQFATAGMPHTMAVDETGGRVFALAGSEIGPTSNGKQATWAIGAATGRSCRQLPLHNSPCVAGVHVFDASTLALQRTVPVGNLSTDGALLYAVPRALRYEPPNDHSSRGKILMLLEEHMSEVGNAHALRPRAINANVTYAVQLDPETATRDWIVRLEPCHGPREQPGASSWQKAPYPGAIFRDPEQSGIWVGCHSGTSNSGTAVWMPLDARGVPTGLVPSGEQAGSMVLPAAPDQSAGAGVSPAGPEFGGPAVYVGPERVPEILADPPSGRMVMRQMQRSGAETWMVFDGRRREFLGRVGTGNRGVNEGYAGIDPETGRLYVLHAKSSGVADGGLFIADIRRTPIPQALRFPELSDVPTDAEAHPLSVLPAESPGGAARIFLSQRRASQEPRVIAFRIIEDAVPPTTDPPLEAASDRTQDLEEREGLTARTIDGSARGFGARAILLGGADSAARVGFADPIGLGRGAWNYVRNDKNVEPVKESIPPPEPCTPEDREVIVGFVGPDSPSVVDAAGARGGAVPLRFNGRTTDDVKAPVSRCHDADWQELWANALFGRPPIAEPGSGEILDFGTAECVSATDADTQSQRTGEPVFGMFAAEVDCQSDETRGFSYFRGFAAGEVSLAEALSSFRIYRDPVRGIVSRVESIARGVKVDGVFSISSIRGVAESWANGRRQPSAESDRDQSYVANCDRDRTAGTCFQAHVFGVWTPGWSCGPCGDERAFTEGMNRALGSYARVRLRRPDPHLAQGSEDGYIAAVQKGDAERFADLTLNNDLLQTTVPVLEIVRYTSPYRGSAFDFSYQDRAGRQILQFAGVEVSSSYSIQCLLVYDEATNTCAAAQEVPGSLKLELTMPDGKPLAGGAFELRADSDEDGVVGLVDKLVPEGACVTAEDGVGNCTWDALPPGKYVVNQIAAPPGYSAVTEPYAVELVSGEARTVTFTNVSNISAINVTAADENDQPLAGATFAVYADPDADGKVAPDAEPVAQCETGPDGACAMSVPVGSYVLVQLAAPGGLEPIEPVAFAFTAGGETAAVTVVNYPQGIPAPPPAAAQVDYLPPAEPPLPQLHAVPLPVAGIPMDDEPQIAGSGIGGTIVRVVQAPGDVLRLLARDPVQAAAFGATLLLLTLAYAGVQRRRQLLLLTGDLSG